VKQAYSFLISIRMADMHPDLRTDIEPRGVPGDMESFPMMTFRSETDGSVCLFSFPANASERFYDRYLSGVLPLSDDIQNHSLSLINPITGSASLQTMLLRTA